jgi:hypothetical protein
MSAPIRGGDHALQARTRAQNPATASAKTGSESRIRPSCHHLRLEKLLKVDQDAVRAVAGQDAGF